KDGRVRVTDFGLALPLASAIEDEGESDPALTRTGALVGTPAYMAAEQLAGRPVDARADQFAFPAALDEAPCGGRPFAGAAPAALLEAIRGGQPRMATLPGWLARLLVRALAADPAARYPTMRALVDELDRERRPSWPRWAALGVVAAVAAAALV